MMIIGPRQVLDLTHAASKQSFSHWFCFGISLINAEKTVAIVPNVPIVQSLRSFQAVEDNGLGGESRLISPRRLPEREV